MLNIENNELVLPVNLQIPDFVLLNVSVPKKILKNESCEIVVEIANYGNFKAENFSTALYFRGYYGDELISSKRTSLNPNESTKLSLPWKPVESGSLSLKIITDHENEITELNGRNNHMIIRVNVEEVKELKETYSSRNQTMMNQTITLQK